MSLNIRVGRFALESDRHNFVVKEERTKDLKEGGQKTRMVEVGYFGKIDAALGRLVDLIGMRSEAESIDALRHEVIKAKEAIIEEIRKANVQKKGEAHEVRDQRQR